MIYTCYEMIRDCRNNQAGGWVYFVRNYVPVVRCLLAHYNASEEPLERVLRAIGRPESHIFQQMEPGPERWFLAELRQSVLAELESPAAETVLDPETVAAALEPLTLLEKQAAWLETMRYSAAESAEMLRMSAGTVEKIRERALDLIRGQIDTWNRTLLAANGIALGRSAAASATPECLAPKVFLDVLDGRSTWRGREEMERHAARCWHCVDHFCRLVEVIELLRGLQPLTEEQAAPYVRLLGVKGEAGRRWGRWFA